jgi:hypothetical protein
MIFVPTSLPTYGYTPLARFDLVDIRLVREGSEYEDL